jgi:hypothetical protein
MDENQSPDPNPASPPPRPERPWQEEQRAISDIDQKISRLEGLPQAPAPVRPPESSGGGGSKRWAGVPIALAAVFGMRLLFGLSRHHDSTSYQYSPPPTVKPIIRDDPIRKQEIDEILRDLRQKEQNNMPGELPPPSRDERKKPVGPPEP